MPLPWTKKNRAALYPKPAVSYVLKRASEKWIIHAELSGDVATPGPVLVTGIDGIGKTNLLERAAKLGQVNHWVVIRARMEEAPDTLDNVAEWISSQLDEADIEIATLRTTFVRLLKSWLKRGVSIKLGPALEGEIGKAKGEIELGAQIAWDPAVPKNRGDAWVSLQSQLQKVGKRCKEKGRGLLFLYDNLEELLDAKNGVALVDFVVESLYYARTTGVPLSGFLALSRQNVLDIQKNYPDFGTRCTLFEVEPLSLAEITKMTQDWKLQNLITPEQLKEKTAGHTTLVTTWLKLLRKGQGQGYLTGPLSEEQWNQTEGAVKKALGEDLYNQLLDTTISRFTDSLSLPISTVSDDFTL